MEANLKEKSWHTKLYKWSYCTYHLPDSLCNYFWALVTAILLLPITVFSLFQTLININANNLAIRIVQGLFTMLLLYGLITWGGAWYENPAFQLAIVICIFISLVILFVVMFLLSWFSAKRWKNNETLNLITLKIQAKKSKVCPKINWVKSEEKQ